ncbi:MAG TPA: hypothetical protein PKO15_11600 [Fibrobacteria bacterium]|nr:hypothetical protein [Fibrobacteria bacterium]
MKKSIYIQVILATTLFASPFRQFRISDPDGKCNMRADPDVKSEIEYTIESGRCVTGELLDNGWARVAVMNNRALTFGYIHSSRLITDATCDTNQFQSIKCELMERSLSDVSDFCQFEEWMNKYFEPQCDDGSHSEATSNFVVSKLSSNWELELRALQSDCMTSQTRNMLIKHVDEAADSMQLNSIQMNLKTCKDDPKHVCKFIFAQIRKSRVK